MKLYDDQWILITGAAGFIGSCLLRYLNDKGIKNLIIVDDLGNSEKWKNLVGKSFVDIISKHNLFAWLDGKEHLIEAVIHLGACSSTVEDNADYLLNNNYRFSLNLAEYAIKNNIRFIYASSAATYGDGLNGFSDNETTLETLQPLNMYGFSKQLFDLWIKNQDYLNRVVGLKFFNVFGPNEYHKGRMASAIVHMLPQIQKEGEIRLFKSSDPDKYADGDQQRDFIYVKDVVKMIYSFLINDATGIFNIGSGKANTWNEIAKALFKALKLPTKIKYISMPEDLIGKYQNYTCADMAKTKNILRTDAKNFSLDDSVNDYVCNYLLPGKTW